MGIGIGKALSHLAKAEIKNVISPSSENEQAVMDARNIVWIVIGVYLIASLLPSAISQLNAANTSGWTATQIAIWSVISIIIIAVVIIKITE